MKKEILQLENLSVDVGNKKNILKDLSLFIEENQTYVLFGPNGSGKTTLLMTIAGLPQYKVSSGRIIFAGKDITNLSIDSRAKLGIATGFQLPPEITGVKLRDILKVCLKKKPGEDLSKDEIELVKKFKLFDFLDRDINVHFSGGERKRAEVLQLLLMKPKLMLIDEPDSGVDIETMELIGSEIRNYLKKTKSSALIITHQGSILHHLKAERACVLLDRKIYCAGNPTEVLKSIENRGYQKCLKCKHPMKNQI